MNTTQRHHPAWPLLLLTCLSLWFVACPAEVRLKETTAGDASTENASQKENALPDQRRTEPSLDSGSVDRSEKRDAAAPDSVPCPPNEEFFEKKIWTPILSLKCISCHHKEGAAKGSRFLLVYPSQADYLKTNLAMLTSLAKIRETGGPILLSRASGLHPKGHPGGKLIRPGSQEYQDMSLFVGKATGSFTDCSKAPVDACKEEKPGKRMLRRLTPGEYDRTITALFGIPSKWGASFAKDPVVHGFSNHAKSLTVSSLLADQLRRAAEGVVAAVSGKLLDLSSCRGQQTSACAENFVSTFGAKVFRRPLSANEVKRYMALYLMGSRGGFTKGLGLVLTAMLQSPHFLYRRELGSWSKGDKVATLNSYEIASQLSYFLQGGPPDAALQKLAASQSLTNPTMIAREAKRLVKTPESLRMVQNFIVEWLGIQRVLIVPKDGKIYPKLTPAVRAAMLEEAKAFVAYVLQEGTGTLKELLTARYVVINALLASYYGLPAPKKVDSRGFGKVPLPQDRPGGLLALGAVLTTHARPNSSSPIHRGLLVREKFFCQELPPPPANINAQPPGLDPSLTTRERYKQHAQDKMCSGCHNLIDPIGFGFERFDGSGIFRSLENGKSIDTRGEILQTPSTSGPFKGLLELSKKLGDSKDVLGCFSLQMLRWGYGVSESPAMLCMLKGVREEFVKSGGNIQGLQIALTKTLHFRERVVSSSVTDPGDVEPLPVPDAGPLPEPTPDKGPTGNLQVKVTTKTKWNSGYCDDVVVTNQGKTDETWEVRLQLQGKITTLWNATSKPDGKFTLFRGVSWNKVLKPGARADFGYCVSF